VAHLTALKKEDAVNEWKLVAADPVSFVETVSAVVSFGKGVQTGIENYDPA
jgi:hypothetical protein